ncbi:MAG TPA: GDP-mannose 4,6-dehydratase [Vicinamibacterales bacterium]|nr:GDP-mannose 4,6-dehydratase [Vicinamibacterales bacterium]
MAGPSLVTGGNGFAGSHLIEHLLAFEPALAAWSRPGGVQPEDEQRVHWRRVDVLDRADVAAAIAELRPAVIYHCAGAADVGGSWSNPAVPLRVNALGTHHVLDGVRLAGLACTVLVTGSALVYRPSLEALTEASAIGPTSPYGLSKLAQEMVAARATWCPTLLTRSFNHVGPRQSPAYATSNFARQIAEIEAGIREPVIRVGNLDSRRDISDVRDTVRAYRALVERGRPGVPYNVCCGRAYRVGDLLDVLLGLARVAVSVERDPRLMRPSDNPVLLGDPSRIAADTGWQPVIPIERTLSDLLEFWRRRAGA